ncbi:hypothetical protein [Streptomyces sp. NPDC090029]|uniref:hypothetical protein n=1 Tax=Streptomyces sp. NPDC090029 TaxID=3365924 RepID=UPI00380578AC
MSTIKGKIQERIALLVGHSSQATTEAVYRKQLRPVITEGAEAMDDIFVEDQEEEGPGDSREGGVRGCSVTVGSLFGPPITTEGRSQSSDRPSEQRRGGGI